MTVDVEAFEQRINQLPAGPPVPWFLDIDGVVNIIGRRPRGGWPRYENTMSEGIEGLIWPICFAPALMGLLNLLAERKVVSFRWLTTWEHDGPAKFAPSVGLKLGAWVAAEDLGDPTRPGTGWWKLDAIKEHLNDSEGLFIWTDDDISDYLSARQVVEMLPGERIMVVCPDARNGLNPEEFDAILTAIEETRWA